MRRRHRWGTFICSRRGVAFGWICIEPPAAAAAVAAASARFPERVINATGFVYRASLCPVQICRSWNLHPVLLCLVNKTIWSSLNSERKNSLISERDFLAHFANFDVVYYDFARQARTKISWTTASENAKWEKISGPDNNHTTVVDHRKFETSRTLWII